MKGTDMNAKILYVATVGLALASSFAFADPARSLTREEVVAQYNQALATHTLRKTDYDFDIADRTAAPAATRSDVLAELARARTATPLIRSMCVRDSEPGGTSERARSDSTRMDPRRLLKSCATPAAKAPRLSIFCVTSLCS